MNRATRCGTRSHLLDLGAAICAEGIAGPHGGLALRAGGMKVVAAVRAVVGARVDAAPTLRALHQNGIPQQKIQYETDRVRNQDNDQCPQRPVHAATARIPVDVADH